MAKSVALFIALVMVFTLPACSASKSDIRKADAFITSLTSFESDGPTDSMGDLAEMSASVINLPAKAFDFNNDWVVKNKEREKKLSIFNSNATLSIYLESGKIERVNYTFSVDSVKDIYHSADNLIDIYGEPASVYLNGTSSSHSEVDRATNNSDDPELTYSYVWKTKLQGQFIYVYEAYYYASGINFSYIIFSNHLNIADASQNKWWN